jgi:hypothetical protein
MNRMREKKVEQEQAAPPRKERVKARMPRAFISVLNGSFLTREKVLGNMPFILFCAGLMIAYIAYGYHTERIVRELSATEAELKEQRSEYITVRAQLEKTEQQSRVAARIVDLGLKESVDPPVKVMVTRKELKSTRTP